MNEEADVEIEKVEILKSVGYQPYKAQEIDLTTSINNKVDKLALTGMYTKAELNRFKTIGGRWENIKDPYGSNKTASEIIDINPADLLLPPDAKMATLS